MKMRIAVAIVAAMLSAGTAHAGLETTFSGNTQPKIDATQGFINFAVFDTTGGSVGDHYGTGDAGIDAALAAAGFSVTSKFLYLFQNVNEGPDIASGSVNVNAALVTGHGALGGLTYAQVTAVNPFLGPAPAAPGNVSPAVTGATQVEGTATPTGLAVLPTLVTLNPSSLVATFSPAISGMGAFSTLWGYTSDRSPSFARGSIQDSGVAANGIVPSAAVPEPAALVQGTTALIILAALAGLRRKLHPRMSSISASPLRMS